MLRFVAKYIYVGLARFATVEIISYQASAERNAYIFAEQALRKAHEAGDPAAIAQATEGFKNAFRALVRYDGAASP